MVFGTSLDPALKLVLKATTDAPDILSRSPFTEMMHEIIELLNDESGLAGAAKTVTVDEGSNLALELDEDMKLNLSMLVTAEELELDEDQELKLWYDAAEQHVHRFVKLVIDQETTQERTLLLQSAALIEQVAEDKKLIFFYDAKVAGEASAQPHCRLPLFRNAHLKKHLQAFVQARKQDHQLASYYFENNRLN